MLLGPILINTDAANWLLRDADDNLRAALICWGIAISGFIVLRIPREVLLGCLVAGAATVGLAATVVEVVPAQATAGVSRTMPSPARYRGPAPVKAPHTTTTEQERRH